MPQADVKADLKSRDSWLVPQAEEGCKVCVLIWDDRTSKKVMGLSGGMLHTHDEETHAYFEGTNVSVGKSLRCSLSSVCPCLTCSVGLFTLHERLSCVT